jgi:hypothetical protein
MLFAVLLLLLLLLLAVRYSHTLIRHVHYMQRYKWRHHFSGSFTTLGLASHMVESYGGVHHNSERLCRLNNKLEFSQSLAAIMVLEQWDAVHSRNVVN